MVQRLACRHLWATAMHLKRTDGRNDDSHAGFETRVSAVCVGGGGEEEGRRVGGV